MPISNVSIFSMLRTKMQWHQERQRLLAENVANADTPKFQPRDLAPPALDRMQPAPVLGLGYAVCACVAMVLAPDNGTTFIYFTF